MSSLWWCVMTKKQKAEMKKYIDQIKQEAKDGPGKPSTLTDENLLRIKSMLFEGQYQKYVYQSLGIPKPTWNAWSKRGHDIAKAIQDKKKKWSDLKPLDEKCLMLANYIDRGKAIAIAKHVQIVGKAGDKDWRASTWYLAKLDPEHFGDKLKADVNVSHSMQDLHDAYAERMNKKNGKG